MIEPLRLSFVVACSPDHAFTTWTAKATAWWPPEHTVSHVKGARVFFEPRVGGRIFERAPTGEEFEWGQVTVWLPPRRLAYSWHIATDPAEATDVAITFVDLDGASTRVDIEHGGWERLGPKGQPWRDANMAGWNGTMPSYRQACDILNRKPIGRGRTRSGAAAG